MQLKIKSFISVMALLLAGLIGPLSSEAGAASAQVTNPGTSAVGSTSQPDFVAAAYGVAAFSDYTRSGQDTEVSADKLTVSSVSEVNIWTMLVAIFGLITLRLWHGGKKHFPAIN
ncbi:MAG: hypothetical protein ACYCZJ_07595 [Sulfuriferula sp.]